MDKPTYQKLLERLEAEAKKEEARKIEDTLSKWEEAKNEYGDSCHIVDNIRTDPVVSEPALHKVLKEVYNDGENFRETFQSACEQIIKEAYKNSFSQNVEYSMFLDDTIQDQIKRVGRAISVWGLSNAIKYKMGEINTDVCSKSFNHLKPEDNYRISPKALKGILTTKQIDVSIMTYKFSMGRKCFPIWITFNPDFSNENPFYFITTPHEFLKAYQARACLGFGGNYNEDLIVFSYKLSISHSEKLRTPTVIDGNTYSYFKPIISKDKKFGKTENLRKDELDPKILHSENIQKIIKEKEQTITVKDIFEKEIKELLELSLEPVPESVYFSEKTFTLGEVLENDEIKFEFFEA